MKTKLLSIVIFLLVTSASDTFAQKKGTITIKETDNGKTFTVKPKQSFNILFKKECVGCAQVWTIQEIDSSIVKLVSKSHKNKSCENCAGGTLDRIFHFKALKPGTTNLSFTYFDKILNVKIRVKKT
jgi:predicted secreted protein